MQGKVIGHSIKDLNNHLNCGFTYQTLHFVPWHNFQDLFRILGVHEFLPANWLVKFLGQTVCDTFTRIVCEDILFILAGFDRQQLNAVSEALLLYIA